MDMEQYFSRKGIKKRTPKEHDLGTAIMALVKEHLSLESRSGSIKSGRRDESYRRRVSAGLMNSVLNLETSDQFEWCQNSWKSWSQKLPGIYRHCCGIEHV